MRVSRLTSIIVVIALADVGVSSSGQSHTIDDGGAVQAALESLADELATIDGESLADQLATVDGVAAVPMAPAELGAVKGRVGFGTTGGNSKGFRGWQVGGPGLGLFSNPTGKFAPTPLTHGANSTPVVHPK